jgi:DNA-binding MarR family transcriptional regulator
MAERKRPTPKQIEAYAYVYIHQCKHGEAAELMGCSRSNVTRLLSRLKKSNPQLFPQKLPFRVFSLNEKRDSQPIKKF